MKTILTAATAALIGLSVLASGPAMAGHKGKSHSWHKYPYWLEPDCYYQKVWVFSPKHGHKIKKTVLVCD
jgi:hypothetical protein